MLIKILNFFESLKVYQYIRRQLSGITYSSFIVSCLLFSLIVLPIIVFILSHTSDIMMIINDLYSSCIKLFITEEPAPIIEIIPEPEPIKKEEGFTNTQKVLLGTALVVSTLLGVGIIFGIETCILITVGMGTI